MSEANEEKTSGDFREMGLRLAQEVTSFVKKKMDKATRHGNLKSIKISFVGHSIGNIILRTALTGLFPMDLDAFFNLVQISTTLFSTFAESIMEPYLRYLHTYVSISGPHLGYLYSSNSLFNSGLWLLKKLKGTQCIHQLTFTDDPDIQNTFLYKLCKVLISLSFFNSFAITFKRWHEAITSSYGLHTLSVCPTSKTRYLYWIYSVEENIRTLCNVLKCNNSSH